MVEPESLNVYARWSRGGGARCSDAQYLGLSRPMFPLPNLFRKGWTLVVRAIFHRRSFLSTRGAIRCRACQKPSIVGVIEDFGEVNEDLKPSFFDWPTISLPYYECS